MAIAEFGPGRKTMSRDGVSSRRTPFFYVGARTFADPTPKAALEHLEPSPEKPEEARDPRNAITYLSGRMKALKEQRERGEITKSEFRAQHGELKIVYRAIVSAHINART